MRRRRRRKDPTPLRDLVPGILEKLQQPPEGPLARVRRVWPEIVGPATARRTRIAAVEGGRIRVEVASAALKHDLLTFRFEEVMRKLRLRLPELRIRDVRYRVGAVS